MRRSLAVIAALIAAPAFATEAPVATAGADKPASATAEAAPAPPPVELTTAQQIDEFLRTSPARETAADRAGQGAVDGVVSGERQVHGEVSVGVGTHGYRSVYARTDLPVGKTGTVSIAIGEERNGYGGPYGRGYGPGYGRGDGRSRHFGAAIAMGGSASPMDRQRCDLEGVTPPRPMDAMGGPNGRCVAPARLPDDE